MILKLDHYTCFINEEVAIIKKRDFFKNGFIINLIFIIGLVCSVGLYYRIQFEDYFFFNISLVIISLLLLIIIYNIIKDYFFSIIISNNEIIKSYFFNKKIYLSKPVKILFTSEYYMSKIATAGLNNYNIYSVQAISNDGNRIELLNIESSIKIKNKDDLHAKDLCKCLSKKFNLDYEYIYK